MKEFSMIIVCQHCNRHYQLYDGITEERKFLVKCSGCGTVFTAYRPSRIEEIAFFDLQAARNDCIGEKVIAISNQKGGVAKTSTCLNLGMSLALMGKRILLIDFDVQSNLSLLLGFHNKPSFCDAALNLSKPLSDYIVQTAFNGLWLLPSNKNMVMLNKKYFGAHNFEFLLKDRLAAVLDSYDHIIIDTPPSIEFFTINALTAANLAVIPSQCDYLSVRGVDQVLKVIHLIEDKINPNLTARVLITMYDKSSTASKLIFSKLRELYKEKTFNTFIEFDDKVKEAQILNVPVMQYDRQSAAGLQYSALAAEMLAQCSCAA
jgi:chromosome partitioning protein